MGRAFNIWYALFLVGAWAVFTMARLNSAGFLVMSFEGDALHMAQTVLRVTDGQVPHRDFQTPLGLLAFLPVSGLMWLGFGLGKAFVYTPGLLALLCLPAVYWVGVTRFKPLLALGFATVFMAMMFSYIHGGLLPSVSASMYYNNWGWAVSMPVVAVAVLQAPERPAQDWIDGAILGVGIGFLTLSKATYAVFLLPAVLLSLSIHGHWRKLVIGAGIGLVFLAVFTLPYGGLSYWAGYINDLKTVAGSDLRAQPGLSIGELVTSSRHLPGMLALLAAVVFLRQAQRMEYGLVLLVLGIGWFLITYQNWQNDPQWMLLAGLLLFPMAAPITLYNSFGWPLKTAIQTTAIALVVLGAPLSLTQLQSLLVHRSLPASGFPATLPVNPQADFRFQHPAKGIVWQKTQLAALSDPDKPEKVSILGAEILPYCAKNNGLVADLTASGKLIDALPNTKGKSAIYADWVASLWMFSGLNPLQGGAPWYYGGKPGFANADYLVVPLCPMGPGVRRIMLEQITADPTLDFAEVSRNDLFILLEKTPAGTGVFHR